MKYEKEKEYCAKRAGELRCLMIKATQACDKVAFTEAFQTAERYMSRKELGKMMTMFVTHMEN